MAANRDTTWLWKDGHTSSPINTVLVEPGRWGQGSNLMCWSKSSVDWEYCILKYLKYISSYYPWFYQHQSRMTSSDGVRLDSLCYFIFLREKTNAATFTPLHNKFKHKQPKTTSQTRLHNNHKRTVDSYQVAHVLKTISWTDDIFYLYKGLPAFKNRLVCSPK